mgnify:CR=1 FL=1
MLKKIYLFIIIILCDYCVYKIRYDDGGETKFMTLFEALDVWFDNGGKIIIDYDKADI